MPSVVSLIKKPPHLTLPVKAISHERNHTSSIAGAWSVNMDICWRHHRWDTHIAVDAGIVHRLVTLKPETFVWAKYAAMALLPLQFALWKQSMLPMNYPNQSIAQVHAQRWHPKDCICIDHLIEEPKIIGYHSNKKKIVLCLK